jgi:hypothetical protein
MTTQKPQPTESCYVLKNVQMPPSLCVTANNVIINIGAVKKDRLQRKLWVGCITPRTYFARCWGPTPEAALQGCLASVWRHQGLLSVAYCSVSFVLPSQPVVLNLVTCCTISFSSSSLAGITRIQLAARRFVFDCGPAPGHPSSRACEAGPQSLV